jgi:hypothetical protein
LSVTTTVEPPTTVAIEQPLAAAGATIFKCSFESQAAEQAGAPQCHVKFSGKNWNLNTVNDIDGNELDKYYAVELESEEQSQLFFPDAVPKPNDGNACLSFRYKKYLEGNRNSHV